MLVARLQLRDYQQRALVGVAAAYREGARAIVLVMPTGSGKTVTGLRFAYGAVDKGRRVLWIAHRRELVHQPARRIAADGARCGLILEGEPSTDPGAPIQVASVWTAAALARLPDADVVVWDEAHHATAKTFRTIRDRYPDALHLGLTATPERADGTALGNVFQQLVAPVGIGELVAAGHLVPCEVIGPPRMLDGLSMDPVEAVLQHAGDRQTVLFAATVGEAEEYAQRLTARGVPAASVDGSMPARARDEALARFARRELRAVTNVYVLTEGWDCPETSVCVLARGCGSAATFLQMVGRALRPAPGKDRALLIDLRGTVHQHGLPDEDRTYSLDGKAIRAKEARLPLRQCPTCGGVARPRPACGKCGFVFPAPRRRAVEGVTIGAVQTRPRVELLETWRGLVLRARTSVTRDGRPYSPTWAAVRFKEQFGFWPPRDFPRAHEVAA